jgi:maleate isomerase
VTALPMLDEVSCRRIGIIAPFDLELDREYWQYVPDDVSVHITRTAHLAAPVGVELAEAVADEAEMERATGSLRMARPGVIAYACTSGSFTSGVAGEARLRETIERAGAARAVTTSGALVEALAALRIERVALGTPYTDELAERLRAFVTEAGHTPVSLVSMGLEGDIAAVQRQRVLDLAARADRPEAEALFLACTNLPTFDLIGPLEAQLGRPVLTANQVTMWAALRAIGSPPAPSVAGQRLFLAAPTGGDQASGRSAVAGPPAHPAHERVRRSAADRGVPIEVVSFPESTHTAEEAARAIGAELGQIVKSLVFVAPVADASGAATPAAVMALVRGTDRVDIGRLGQALGRDGLRRATADEAARATGYAIGGIPPFGHREPLPVVMDPGLLRYPEVWAAAGTPNAVFRIDPARLRELSAALVAHCAATAGLPAQATGGDR